MWYRTGNRLILISTIFLVSGFVALLFYTINYHDRMTHDEKWVQHSTAVLSKISAIDNGIISLTAAQRAVMVSGSDRSLQQYEQGKKQIKENVLILEQLVSISPEQVVLSEKLMRKIDTLIAVLDDTLLKNKNEAQNIILVDQQELSQAKESLLDITSIMRNQENAILDSHANALIKRQYNFIIAVMGGIVTLFALLIGINTLLLRLRLANKRYLEENLITKQRLEYAMNVSGEGVYDWNIKTNKVYYSETFTKMLGYERADFGDNFDAFDKKVHEDDRAIVHQRVDDFISGKLSDYSMEFRMYHKDGQIIWVHSRADMRRDQNGEADRIIGTHRDITAIKLREGSLIDSIETTARESNAKSGFLAHMSHEIRTPLTAISGIAEILQKQSSSMTEKQQKLIHTLVTSSQSLKDLVTDILDFSKIERGDIDIDYNYFAVSKLSAEIISIMSVQAQEKNIGFKVVDQGIKNIEYQGDKARIRQILINLVGNAIKFTDKGQVTLLIEHNFNSNLETLDFIIQDTGVGIEKNTLETIFEEFQQADRSISKKHGGTGLGLPISKKLALLMGGDITVTSKPDMGSTFKLTLPMVNQYKVIADEENSDVKTNKRDRLIPNIQGESSALIADDYEGNIIILGYLMDDIGLKYDVANNGEEALKMWEAKRYDIILMDVQMPVMDGLSATQKIRQAEKKNGFDTTPIIGMTAHALVEDKQKCIDAGMTDYLSKPIDSQKLKQKIYNYLSVEDKKIGDSLGG